MSAEIPSHVQEEIIKRLPVISLLRFRAVSKEWKSVIDNSNFIAAHSAHSVTQPQHLFLKYEDYVADVVRYVSYVDDDTFPQQRSVHTLPQSAKLLRGTDIIGSALGLLCIHGYTADPPNLETEMCVLWNPTIRKSIAVALPKNPNPDDETDVGFGVCPVTGDPKIVHVTQITNPSYHCKAEVFSVSSGKWRSLSSNLPSKPFRVLWPQPQVVVGRFTYWCAFDPLTMENGLPDHNQIMSFDTTDEKFGVVDLPDSLRSHSPYGLGISKVRESLVVLQHDDYLKHSCAVWVMENVVEKSFTKLFTVETPCPSKIITTLGLRKSGQPLMEMEEAAHRYTGEQIELLACDPNAHRFDYLGIYGLPETFRVYSYTETLVLHGLIGCSSY